MRPQGKLSGMLCRHVVAAVLATQGGIADESNDIPKELSIRLAERGDAPLIFDIPPDARPC